MTWVPRSTCLTVTPTALSWAASQSDIFGTCGRKAGSPEMDGMATASESRAIKAGAEASMYERSSAGAGIVSGESQS